MRRLETANGAQLWLPIDEAPAEPVRPTFEMQVDAIPEPERFDGATYDAAQDGPRLTGQIKAVYDFMAPGEWHTLADIADATGASEASASARLRDLRKWRFGHHSVERERIAQGLYAYRLVEGGE
jgi:hypothetical protein